MDWLPAKSYNKREVDMEHIVAEYTATEKIKTGQAVTLEADDSGLVGIRLVDFQLDFGVVGIAAHDINEGDKVSYSTFESTPDVLVSFPKSQL